MEDSMQDDEEFLIDSIGRIAAHLRQSDVSKSEFSEEILRLTLDIAIETRNRLVENRERVATLERLVVTDELTGLLNRRGFAERVRFALSNSRRQNLSGVLIHLDIDDFKQINDNYGHPAGDEALKVVARLLTSRVRETDAVARMGGDEFSVLLVESRWTDGWRRAREMQSAIDSTYLAWEGHAIPLKASLGVENYVPNVDFGQLIRKADDAMYKAKRERKLAAE
jgi:diguanylate cyclase (GGDEF)-like protein